ncbi:glycosyltransferase family 61 protein [Qipengyuania atrilutea]|uniref:Glycosyltransferase family 61 protein n=1 Tax=Qipengyuania atrilutea TaxID=2744473 RepID=A0A850H237_9SPHN|nr:glycosyltransferase family 61 protein [Actirhodobacter atriluteus]NVD44746.1 glycosyltransferase family 61 protein [Actirhodobacter atriluteus]
MNIVQSLRSIGRRLARSIRRSLVEVGVSPARVGYRDLKNETPLEYHERRSRGGRKFAEPEIVHSERHAANPLPVNVTDRDKLPRDSGWWHYSMYDVPNRLSSPTRFTVMQNATVITGTDDSGLFYPAILTDDNRAINMREVVFRPLHAKVLLDAQSAWHIEKATWFCERSYANHSHWLTAHLPKLVLLKELDRLNDVLLPTNMTPVMRRSIEMLGLDPSAFPTFEPGEVLKVGELTLLETDRFRGDLLKPVRAAIAPAGGAPASRRIFISRKKAAIRKLANEDEIWPLFEEAGFERVFMEDLGFEEQIELMSQTQILAGPHGAGLTNMMFCPAGSTVLEIAWLGFPNPNFYALACAMELRYALVEAEVCEGDAVPLKRDMTVRPEAIAAALKTLEQ